MAYEVYSLRENGATEAVVYSRGSATLLENTGNPVLDLKAWQTEGNGRRLSGAEIYGKCREIGFEYGPGHQGIEAVYPGRGLTLAKLILPQSVAGTEEQFGLHPSIMDAALQVSVGMEAWEADSIGKLKLSLPFALEELVIYSRCPGITWALLRHSNDNTPSSKVKKLDIDLCNEQGRVWARLKGLSLRALDGEFGETGTASIIGKLLFEPVWKEQTATPIER